MELVYGQRDGCESVYETTRLLRARFSEADGRFLSGSARRAFLLTRRRVASGHDFQGPVASRVSRAFDRARVSQVE